jgi:hypothetical protein
MTEVPMYTGIFTGFLSSRYATIPVAARSKAWFCGRGRTGISGSNPAGSMDVLSLLNVVWYQVGKSLRRADYLSR